MHMLIIPPLQTSFSVYTFFHVGCLSFLQVSISYILVFPNIFKFSGLILIITHIHAHLIDSKSFIYPDQGQSYSERSKVTGESSDFLTGCPIG